MGPEYSRGFQQLFKELARKNQAVLIPFLLEGVAGHAHLNQPDGIHPNAAGHQIIAQTVVKYLEPLL
jgi:acyl-CoA thioesterase-1